MRRAASSGKRIAAGNRSRQRRVNTGPMDCSSRASAGLAGDPPRGHMGRIGRGYSRRGVAASESPGIQEEPEVVASKTR